MGPRDFSFWYCSVSLCLSLPGINSRKVRVLIDTLMTFGRVEFASRSALPTAGGAP